VRAVQFREATKNLTILAQNTRAAGDIRHPWRIRRR